MFNLKFCTAAEWLAADPVLLNGEPGFDTTNKILKLGDGQHCWTALKPVEGTLTSGVLSFVVRVDGGNFDD